jgi:hypothetical protein
LKLAGDKMPWQWVLIIAVVLGIIINASYHFDIWLHRRALGVGSACGQCPACNRPAK